MNVGKRIAMFAPPAFTKTTQAGHNVSYALRVALILSPMRTPQITTLLTIAKNVLLES